MTAIYDDYNNTRNAMKNMIQNKQEQIDLLENEIHHLRKSLRILDTEFQEKIQKKETPIEYS